jgi:hypothetical protein
MPFRLKIPMSTECDFCHEKKVHIVDYEFDPTETAHEPIQVIAGKLLTELGWDLAREYRFEFDICPKCATEREK